MKTFLLILLTVIVSVPLFARDAEITIIDADLDLPLEGAVIRSWDGSQYICDSQGKAIITAPENRRVIIQATYPGYETGRLLITPDTDNYTLGLALIEFLQTQELIIEAARPGENETKTGRSIAVSGHDLAQTGRIGAIEDAIASIKLLPGIIATEHFDASPSIRGGEPEDVNASLDGFYISSPYFWGGAFSIFDPRMIESAQLSHGVFSGRYGHTISGLLDLTTRKPSSSEYEIEVTTDASAVRVNLSVPLFNKGGILFMGRTTYIEPIFFVAQKLVALPGMNEDIKDLVNSVNRAPFIRSGTITGNYNFTEKLRLNATAFFGLDGTGVKFENTVNNDDLKSYEKFVLDYSYYQGFITNNLLWNPANNMLLKTTLGTGYQNRVFYDENMYEIYEKSFSQNFMDLYNNLSEMGLVNFDENYLLSQGAINNHSELIYNIQGRMDFDWSINNNLLLAVGVQEIFKQYRASGTKTGRMELQLKDYNDKEEVFNFMGITDDPGRSFVEENAMLSLPSFSDYDILGNSLLNTASYSLIEFSSPQGFFETELGLRLDHYYLWGSQSLGTKPVLNPRFNMDFNIIKNRLMLTAGTGLFSSMNDLILTIEDLSEIDELKPARSWTSVIGTNLKFPYNIIFNLEGYYKYIFNRMYTANNEQNYHFDGEGRSWGIDAILQRTRSRYWDGWISYSYNWTQYNDPNLNNEWYFPYYHRFHSLNLAINVKPVRHINIYTRFGFASGVQLTKRMGSEPVSYPEYVYDSDTQTGYFIEKYYWPEIQDKENRTTPSLLMDVKLSFIRVSKAGKARSEVYFAIENLLSLVYFSKGNTVFNPYTGEIATGRTSASYGLPFPIPSFGVNYSY